MKHFKKIIIIAKRRKNNAKIKSLGKVIMSVVSLAAQVWSCAHPKINGENAARAQSARRFDPALNVVSHIIRPANDPYSGRPAYQNTMNGSNGLGSLGYAGLNPTSWMALETGLRQVEFQANMPNTSFYDTIEGANRSVWPHQKVGASGTGCNMYNGPDSYTSTPYTSNHHGQTMTSADHQKYMSALYQQYRKNDHNEFLAGGGGGSPGFGRETNPGYGRGPFTGVDNPGAFRQPPREPITGGGGGSPGFGRANNPGIGRGPFSGINNPGIGRAPPRD